MSGSARRHGRSGRDRGARKPPAARRCRSCGVALQGRKLYYRVKTQITCEPNELVFTEEDLARDHASEMERINREAEGRDPREFEDEVFVLLDYFLCVECKERFVKEVRT